MAAYVAPLSITVTRGEARTFNYTHQTSGTDSTPINIAGWTIVFTARDQTNTVVLTKSITVSSGPAGTYTWGVTATDTTRDPTSYTCDIWRTDSGSETIMGLGTMVISADVRTGVV